MKRLFYRASLLFLLFLLFLNTQGNAQSLQFEVTENIVDLYVSPNGVVSIQYVIVFKNSPFGAPIDAIDIGLPTNDYALSNITAQINGAPIFRIVESPYVSPGIALELSPEQIIQPGESGTVQVWIPEIYNMLYKTNRVKDVGEAYASFQFSPNSFGKEYVIGSTNFSVTLHLPPGLKPEEPRWFTPKGWPDNPQPESGFDQNGNVFYRWKSSQANSYTQYIFGAAFPARLVDSTALVSEPVISEEAGGAICFSIILITFIGFFVLVIWGVSQAEKKRKLQYLPPKISIEGNGIKRGLTAVEAAIVMEQPLEKVLTMILFSVVRKGAAEVISRNPLKIKVLPVPENVELRSYEKDFLEAMKQEKLSTKRKMLQDLMVNLVKEVSEKMRGFSRKETIEYYQDIIRRAWEQVEAADTPEVQSDLFEKAMDWTMLDRRFEDRSREVFTNRPVIVPSWWGRYDPGFGKASTVSPKPSQVGQAPGRSSLPSLPGADFAASIVGGVQSFASSVIGDVTSFTSGITEKTNPVPKSTTSSSSGGRSGGGGSSCACACACACAGCACACAGGGR
ncbi:MULTISPECIES: hypothetical protein [Anaerolinea]|uniref:hypothetical protein n=1 Tax=Anaerolinea TaxID=233189 RepID=UPI00261F03DD|nr:hypothetical protein [Anaerolinea thermophila]